MANRENSLPCSDTCIDVLRKESLPVRIYGFSNGRKKRNENKPLIVHFHGGSFSSGSLDSGSTVANLLSEAGAIVVSVDYPLAPQSKFPVAVESGHAMLERIHAMRSKFAGSKSPVLIAGEEAGGNIAAAIALINRDRQAIDLSGQILFSPMLNPCLATQSLRDSNAGMGDCRFKQGWNDYLRSCVDADHPYAVPGVATRLQGLPPTLLLTADDDPLRDETRQYAARLHEVKIPVNLQVFAAPSGWPAVLSNTDRTETAKSPVWKEQAVQTVREFLNSLNMEKH